MDDKSIRLYSYFRSSAAFRVRIVLAYKSLDFEVIPIHLLKNGGQQKHPDFCALNPQQLVPVLVVDGMSLSQSMAIIEWLEEVYPQPSLLPSDSVFRAKIRSFSQVIACDIHPLNNLRVLAYLKKQFDMDEDVKQQWYAHWVEQGLAAIECILEKNSADFCFGDTLTMADVFLIPQVYNAKRFAVTMTSFPNVERIYEYCMSLPAFNLASPEQQVDAE